MPLKLVPPRAGKSPNWTIRGYYLGVKVDRTTGTPNEALARKILGKLKADIERGAVATTGAPTFSSAAIDYLDAGGDDRFLRPLTEHFLDTPLGQIDQRAVDAAAQRLYPRATPATRNRQVYTPVSAILRRAGVVLNLKRPKGAQGQTREFFFSVEGATRLIDAATAHDAEFGIFLAFQIYTGARLSEALSLQVTDVDLSRATAFLRMTKNGKPRTCHLPPALIAALAEHPRGLDRAGKVFRFGKNGRLYLWLDAAAEAAGVAIPPRVAFHACRHTYGAWMRREAGLDTSGLVATGAWKDRGAAARYEHVVATEEAKKADLLPNVWKGRGK